MQSSWGLTSIIEIIRTEVAPYFGTDRPRIALEGPDAVIAPNDALSLGLLIHELVTNAAKFGALSNDTGTVSLTWTPAQKQQIRFEWREDGGPPPPADRQRGFGSDLIEKVISRELRSDIKLEFTPSGVRCTFLVPVRQVSPFSLKQNS
jgi:two-component sensor histidine kinase